MYKIELFEKELKSTPKGREILELADKHSDEVIKLINFNREVMITWQRNKGPLFFADIMESGFNKDTVIKKEIEGVNITSLIRRMAVVLQDYGSTALKVSIDEYFLLIIEYAQASESLNQIFQKLRNDG